MSETGKKGVYVDMLVESLKCKKRILAYLLEKTREQENLLKDSDMDPDVFNQTLEEKGQKIEELNQLDEGFDALFKAVEKEVIADRMSYKEEIQEMQQLIGEITEQGVQIQALEQQNSAHFKVYLANQRKTIRNFHVNNRTASTYYQNMANAHKPDQSYFLDTTK